MKNVTVTLTNGSKKVFPINTSFYEVCRSFNMGNEILGVKINNEFFSLSDTLKDDCLANFVSVNDLQGAKVYKGGLEFIFEVALKTVFPDIEINYQHSIPKGFLGEIITDKNITQEDLTLIKSKMAEIIASDIPFKKLNVKKREAINFYKSINQNEKADNVANLTDKVLTMYELNGYYNYYYTDMPYSTGSISKYEIIYLGRNRLIFVLPTNLTEGLLPEYVHYDNIINSFLMGKEWLETLHMKYINSVNLNICTGRIKDFIKSCELVFDINIIRAAQEITANRNIKFVLIAGPSSSGKTTTCKRLCSYLAAQGFDPIKLSTDDFYRERNETPKDEQGNYDYECLNALDLELFNESLNNLLNKREIEIPAYNFITGKKEYDGKYIRMKENSIIIIEGLHCLNDELLPSIDKKLKYKIYLSPFIPLSVDRHNYISTIDLRLIRRIVRDNRTRGYDINKTIHSWQDVRKGEEKNIFPYIHQADIIINTALTYEIGVEKVYIEPLLRAVDIETPYYEEAKRLLNFLKIFYPIPGEYVPADSIIREFIGGNND